MSPSTEEPAAESSVDDETRRKFLAAMARKQGKRSDGSSGHEEGKAPAPHVNAKAQRMFRRKSGSA